MPVQGDGLPACRVEVRRPVFDQPPSALEQVRSRVGRFDLVSDDVRQRRLDDLAPVPSRPPPVPERRPEPMRNGWDPLALEQPAQHPLFERLPVVHGEHEAPSLSVRAASRISRPPWRCRAQRSRSRSAS